MSLQFVEPGPGTSTVSSLPLVIVYGPASSSFLQAAAASPGWATVGVLSFTETDAAAAAGLRATDRFIRFSLRASPAGEVEPSDIRRRVAEIAKERRVTLLLVACEPGMDAKSLIYVLSDQQVEEDFGDLAHLRSTVMATDARSIVDLIVRQRSHDGPWSPAGVAEQIESADIVILESGRDGANASLARAIVSALNPNALIASSDDDRRLDAILETANTRETRRPSDPTGSDSEAFGEGVIRLVYRARRPFHPQRFRDFLRAELRGVARAKGFFWLATKMDVVGGLNVAGTDKQAAPVGEWWAAIADELPSGTQCPEAVRNEWMEPFGDRRQALSFVGVHMDAMRLRERLEACLLTDSEMAAGARAWAALPDPFPDWSQAPHEHECGDHCHHEHQHEHEHEQACHQESHRCCQGH